MEGWRQRRLGSNAKPLIERKKKNRLDTHRPSHGRTWTERTIQIEPPTSFNMKVWILSGKKGRQEDSRERGRNKNIFAVECANMKG